MLIPISIDKCSNQPPPKKHTETFTKIQTWLKYIEQVIMGQSAPVATSVTQLLNHRLRKNFRKGKDSRASGHLLRLCLLEMPGKVQL